jgi:hypothetical protein
MSNAVLLGEASGDVEETMICDTSWLYEIKSSMDLLG